MDLIRVLRKEESKLVTVFEKAETKLSQIRAAIGALNGKPRTRVLARSIDSVQIERKPGRRSGYKMSASHRRAIAEGIRKSKLRKTGGK